MCVQDFLKGLLNCSHFQTFVTQRWDIILIALAGNDCKGADWRGEEAFAADYAELIGVAKGLGTQLTPQPEIFVCTNTYLLQDGAYSVKQHLVNEVLPPAIRCIARNNGVRLIDFLLLLVVAMLSACCHLEV